MSSPVCHLCGERLHDLWATAYDIEYGSTPDSFDYYECLRCEALSIHPLPVTRLHEIYPETYYSFATASGVLDPDRNIVTRTKAKLDRRAFRRVLSRVESASPKILDVGGGTGDIAAGLRASAEGPVSITVVDLDEASINVARSRGMDGFAGRFEDFTSATRFDLILMLNLIEHVADPVATIEHARDLLAPGGILWLQTPNYQSLDARIFRRKSWTGLHCPRHWVVFSAPGLAETLHKGGLTDVTIERSQGGSFWATSTIGALRRNGIPGNGLLPKPLITSPAFMPLAAAGAGFDFATRRLRRTSQLVAFATAPA